MMNRFRIGRWTLPLLVLVLLVFSASAAYGYVWYSQVRADTAYQEMIYNIGKSMGETPGCLD